MTGLGHDPRSTAENVLAQIKLGEDSRVSVKEAHFDQKRVSAPRGESVANELAAFANARGGTLIFSVSGDGEIRTPDRSQMDALEEFVSNICEDRIDPPLSFFTRRLPLPDRRSVLLVTVEGSALVQKSPGGFLTRKGSTVRELSSPALQRLFQLRGRSGLLGPDLRLVAGTGPNSLDSLLTHRFLGSRSAV